MVSLHSNFLIIPYSSRLSLILLFLIFRACDEQGGIDQKAGFNPGLTVLLVVVGAVLIFCVGNYMLYFYAQKNLPPRRKKPVSKKKQKRERLKAGLAPAGD